MMENSVGGGAGSAAAVRVPVATLWTGPDAPRPQDAAAVAELPDMAAWTRAMAASDRLGLHGRTLTQALLGEPVEIIEERGDWACVVLPWQPSSQDARGYPGWLRRAHLDTAGESKDAQVVVVTEPTATAQTATGGLRVSYGTCLTLLDDSTDCVVVSLPGGRSARLDRACVRPWVAEPLTGETLVRSGRRFLGLLYLWGGSSGWGLDCSGFVHLVNRRHGRRVSRDAADQQETARPVALDAAGPGDHYFFATPGAPVHHVGFVTNQPGAPERTMLHAPEVGVSIVDEPLALSRRTTLVTAGSLRDEASRP